VKTAISFDATRGDQVDVESMRFISEAPDVAAVPSSLFAGLDSASLVRLAETGLIGLIGLLALLLVLRPMVLRLTTLSPDRSGGDLALMGPGGLPGGTSVSAEMAMSGPGNAAGIALLEDESMVSVAQIEGQLRASSIRRVSDLAEKHPNETLSILRGWMAQEGSR
jgi:flagellar M-ring protein FliF